MDVDDEYHIVWGTWEYGGRRYRWETTANEWIIRYRDRDEGRWTEDQRRQR